MARPADQTRGDRSKSTGKANLPEVLGKVYSLLEPLGIEDRQRVVESALNLLGDKSVTRHQTGNGTESGTGKTDESGDDADWKGFSEEAKRWAKRHGLTRDLLDEYFHEKSGTVSVINLPEGLGSKQKKSIACYLLQGVAALIQTGDATVNDDTARELCEHQGAYDPPNHSRIFQAMRGLLSGNKKLGWQLTNPGLKEAAGLLKPKDQK
jgi:hypothetical protein